MAIDSNNEIYYRNCLNRISCKGNESIKTKISEKLKDISIGDFDIWGINEKDEIFVFEN